MAGTKMRPQSSQSLLVAVLNSTLFEATPPPPNKKKENLGSCLIFHFPFLHAWQRSWKSRNLLISYK